MSVRFLNRVIRTARKDYYCDLADSIEDRIDEEALDAEDKIVIEKCRSKRWKILKGEKYVTVTFVCDDGILRNRYLPESESLANTYALWDEI